MALSKIAANRPPARLRSWLSAICHLLSAILYLGCRSLGISMRHLLAVYLAVLIVGTLAAADTEGDIAICADEKSPDAMAACTRLIEASAQLPPDKLAEVYDNRLS